MKGLINDGATEMSLRFFADWWTFPLHHENLSPIEVKEADLVEARREHLGRMEAEHWGVEPGV